MTGPASVREVRGDELEAVLALWRESYGTVGVTDSLDDVLPMGRWDLLSGPWGVRSHRPTPYALPS